VEDDDGNKDFDRPLPSDRCLLDAVTAELPLSLGDEVSVELGGNGAAEAAAPWAPPATAMLFRRKRGEVDRPPCLGGPLGTVADAD